MHESYGITATVDELVRQRGAAEHIQLEPRGRVATMRAGGYDSTFRGRGMEFDESRVYQAGDDARTIDWRVTARTGRVHTKLFHEERERPVLLLVDARPHMRFGTRDAFKSVVAARAAATLAWAARDGGDSVGGIILCGSGQREISPQRSRARLLSFLGAISRATAQQSPSAVPSLASAVQRLARVSRPGTLAVLLSDFTDLDVDAERELACLATRAEVACVLIHDRLETEAPTAGRPRMTDGERVLSLAVASDAWRAEYAARFEERRAQLESLCRRRGLAYLSLETGQSSAELLRTARFARAFRTWASRRYAA